MKFARDRRGLAPRARELEMMHCTHNSLQLREIIRGACGDPLKLLTNMYKIDHACLTKIGETTNRDDAR
jgi:hypothetical protein